MDKDRDQVALIDPKGLLTFATPEFMQLFGLDIGQAFMEIKAAKFTSAERSKLLSAFRDALDRIGEQITVTIHLKSKTTPNLEVKLRCEAGKKGKAGSTLCTARKLEPLNNRVQLSEVDHLKYISQLVCFTEDPVFSTDPNFIIQSWNEGAKKLYGFSSEEVIGKAMPAVFPDMEFIGSSVEVTIGRMHTEGHWSGECKFHAANGSWIYVSATVNRITGSDGRDLGFVSIHRDITKKRSEEERLRFLSSLMDNTTDAIFTTDLNMKVRTWNRACEIRYGVPESQAIGKTFNELVAKVELDNNSRPRMLSLLRKDGSFFDVGHVTTLVGTKMDLRVNINTVYDDHMSAIGYVSVHHLANLSEQEQFHKNFMHSLMEVSDDAIYASGLDQRILAWNRTCERLYEVPAKDAIGKRFKDLIKSITTIQGTLKSGLAELEANGKWAGDCIILTKSGKEVRVHNSVTALFDEQGLRYGFIASHRNLSGLHHVHRMNAAREALLDQTSDAVIATDMDMLITSLNRGAERMYSIKEADAVGKRVADVIGPFEFLGISVDKAAAILREKGEWVGDMIVHHFSGKEIVINLKSTLLKDSDGSPLGFVGIHRDITQEWAAEERERYLNFLLAQTSEAVFTLDTDFHVSTWNHGAEVLFEKQANEVIGHDIKDVLDRASYPEMNSASIRKSLTGSGQWLGEMLWTKKNDQVLYIKTSVSRILDPEGMPIGYMGILHNATAIRDKEQDLRHLARITEFTDEAVFSTDNEFQCLSWNKGAEKLYGMSMEDVRGKSLADLLPAREYVGMTTEEVTRTLKDTGHFKGKAKVTFPDGRKIWILSSSTAVTDEHGVRIGYVTIHRNITDLKIAAERNEYLANLLTNSQQAVIMMDGGYHILSWNQGAQKLYGFTEDEVMGREFRDVIHLADFGSITTDEIRKTMFDTGSWTGTFQYPANDGTTLFIEAVVSKVSSKEGKMLGYTAVHRDITEERKNAEHVEYLNKLLQNTSEAVISLDQQFRVIGWNRGASVIYGREAHEVIGLTLSQALPDTIYPEAGPLEIRQALINEGRWEGPMEYPARQGAKLSIQVSASRVLDEQGEFLGFVAIHRDITHQKDIESRNEHLNRMLEHTKDGIVSVDTDFRIRFWNKAAESLLGKTEQEALGLTMQELMGAAKFEDENLQKLRKDLLTNGFVEGDTQYAGLDGKPKFLHMDIRQVTGNDGTKMGYIAMYRDITDVWQKNKESTLNRQMLETIFNSTLEGMSIMDPDGIVLRINDKGLELSGTTRDQRVGKPLWANTFWEKDPEELERLQLALADARQGKITSYTLKFDLGNGSQRHVDISIKPTLDEQGKTIYISSEAKDISGQTNAEEQMQYNAELLNSFQENTPLPSWLMNDKDEIIYMNPIFRDLFGLKPEDAGRKMKDLLPSRFLRQYQTHNDIVRNTGNSLQTLEHAVDTQGMLHTFLVNRFPIRILGRPMLIGGKGVDITELLKAQEEVKEANKRFESVGEATNDLIWELDLSTMTIGEFGNSEILWGSRKNYTHSFDEFLELIDPKDRDGLLKGFEKTLQNRFKDKWHGEFRVNHADGSVRHVLDRAIILRTPDGHPFKVVGTIQDITDRVRLEKELIEQHNEEHKRTTRKIFEAEEKERTRIAGDLHDNVNPLLAAAKMHISIAESHMEDPIPYLLQSKALIYEGIEEIRKISRNLSTNFIKEMSLEEAVDSTVQKLNPGEELHIHTTYRRVDRLLFDPPFKMNIIRIVQEQVHNTLKYAAAKNLYIEVGYREGKLRMVIKDDGKGFDTRQTRPGVGLSNIRSRVESYSGQMKLTSAPGKGTKMEIEIPVKES